MPIAISEQQGEIVHVQRVIAGAIELDRRAGNEECGRLGSNVADGLAEIGKSLAEVCMGVLSGHFRPEQTGQCLAVVRLVGFHDKIG